MLQYKRLNNLVGWLVFAVATFTYCSTIEPTASFWDCGEYIACAYKLEVGHPPGAPFFLLIARFFSLFSFGDVATAAMWINVMSALCSSFSILFLFWTITRFAKKILVVKGQELNIAQIIAIMGSGAIGALAYTFSDSFWFSAVEGEVYAMSSFFTAIVFWAILKWEEDEENDAPYSMKWIILIAYLMGLSIGVHLLNLLVIPAICFIYFYKKYKFSWRGFAITSILSLILLGGIQGGIIPGIVKMIADYELFFTNKIGLPFNTGTIIYFIFLIGFIVSTILYSLNGKPSHLKLSIGFGIAFSLFGVASGKGIGILVRLIVFAGAIYSVYFLRNKRSLLNTIIMSFAMILIGYSSFFILVIRSQANTPMDENDPENAITMLAYLNREQYGDWPILYGNYYNSPLDKEKPYKDGNPVYAKDKKTKKYVITDDRKESIPNYDSDYCTLFPRMWSTQSNHEGAYRSWGNVKGKTKTITQNGEQSQIKLPTFMENLTYFRNYQVNYMYLRYFAWNFIGRQNDVQGLTGSPLEGNWITGFKGFDESIQGADFSYMPSGMNNNKGENKFFALPFLLGLIGFVFHFMKRNRDTFVVFVLFMITGLAIVIYLNQYPYQPRERDYAYAASFYAFAIWIGLGVLALYHVLSRRVNAKAASAIAITASMAIPGIMASEGWDDHNRSKRTMARDFAVNYLNSCAPNAILFTNGDNDTFPLWYAQEVEGIRTDIRVVNLSLLQTDWYINQMRRAAYDSKPVPFTLAPEKYTQGTRDVVYFIDKKVGYTDIRQLMDFVASDDPENKFNAGRPKLFDYFPTNKIRVAVDSAKVVNNGTVPKNMASRIVKSLEWEIKKNYVLKNDLMIMDLLAANNWERPVYFAVTTGADAYLNLDQYLQLEGLAYRLVPIKSNQIEMQSGVRVAADIMYDNIMKKFQWGGAKLDGVYLDENCLRMLQNMRIQVGTLANALVEKGSKDKALKVLDKAMEEMPEKNVPFDATMYSICLGYYQAGNVKKADEIAKHLFDIFEKDMMYYNAMKPKARSSFGREIRQAKDILMRLVSVTGAYGDKALSKTMEQRLPNVIPAEELNPAQQGPVMP